jgi:hypothetical protein
MKIKTIFTAILLVLVILGLASLCFLPVQAQSATPTSTPDATPTYDPFAQPPLPENPTQLEQGRYLFWRYCMPCHGDVGQGLTDEFRYKWEPDHQNCWEAGCHSGKYSYDSFPVATYVPPIVHTGLLFNYSPDSLFEFLRTTHPPEDPGLLTDEEYRALVFYLYHMNAVPFPVQKATATPAPSATPTPLASLTPTPGLLPFNQADSPLRLLSAIGLAALLTVIIIVLFARRARRE